MSRGVLAAHGTTAAVGTGDWRDAGSLMVVDSVPWDARPWAVPLADPNYRAQVWARIRANVETPISDCWEWVRYRRPDGYGLISVKHRMVGVHIVALAISRSGLWSDALQVDHRCWNRPCCNPAHLDLVTPQENSLRGNSAMVLAMWQRMKTHCPKGHLYDEANTYIRIRPSGPSRRCRRCRTDGMIRSYWAKRGVAQ